MADQRDSIDLRTLEEVHRLLASSDFATAEDLAGAGGADHLIHAIDHLRRANPAPTPVIEPSLTPLPRRR